MQKKSAFTPQQTETDEVKLKPIMGIRPGVYLTAAYSVVLLLIVFILLIYPGIKNPTAMLDVKTEPAGAAIRVNGTYMGVSGSRILVPKGTHTIEAALPGFETASTVHQIPSRVFASAFFPRRYKVEFTLTAPDPAAVFAQSAFEYASWSFGGEPTVAWQIPLSLSEGAYRVGTANDPAFYDTLTAASRFTVTRAALRDLVRAKTLIDNGGLSPSPVTLVSSVSDILIFLSENKGSADWLASLLPPDYASTIKNSNWHKNEQFEKTPVTAAQDGRRFELAGISFTGISAANGGLSFFISENPVPLALFEIFLGENPQWEGSFTDYYEEEISFLNPEFYDKSIITGITWYAAEAFCQWLSARLPSSMTAAEMEVRLPTEAQWEYAASTGLRSMQNAGWEWCADPFAPLQFISAPDRAVKAVSSPERTLRGRQNAGAQETRASLPAEMSSPFVTFRPVIAVKE